MRKLIFLCVALMLPLFAFEMSADEKEVRDCGTVMLRYYEYPEQTLTFSNYDSYIDISEKDDNN